MGLTIRKTTKATTEGQADRGHHHLFDQAGDDLAEGCANDDAYRQIDDIASRGEFLELGEQ
jgi:hypothetical protein